MRAACVLTLKIQINNWSVLISGFWDRKFGPQTVGPPRTLFQSLKALLKLTQLAFSSGSRNKQVNSRFSIK